LALAPVGFAWLGVGNVKSKSHSELLKVENLGTAPILPNP